MAHSIALRALPARAQSCIKKIDPEEIEIDIDSIDPLTFWTVDTFTKDCLPGGRRQSKAAKKPQPAAAAAPFGSDSKSKKARVG